MPEFNIRPATASDVAAVFALERGCAEAPHWGLAAYAGMVADNPEALLRRRLLVAVQGDEVVGFAVGSCLVERAELESVVVSPAMRRRGVARALCVAVQDWTRAQGAVALELEVRSANLAARRLYEGLGFIEVGRRPKYYADPVDDAVLMRCTVGPAVWVDHL